MAPIMARASAISASINVATESMSNQTDDERGTSYWKEETVDKTTASPGTYKEGLGDTWATTSTQYAFGLESQQCHVLGTATCTSWDIESIHLTHFKVH
jgi:hypothetical protein